MSKKEQVSEDTLIKAAQERHKEKGSICILCERKSKYGLGIWNKISRKPKFICQECEDSLLRELVLSFAYKVFGKDHEI